jgi:hypothetical protein
MIGLFFQQSFGTHRSVQESFCPIAPCLPFIVNPDRKHGKPGNRYVVGAFVVASNKVSDSRRLIDIGSDIVEIEDMVVHLVKLAKNGFEHLPDLIALDHWIVGVLHLHIVEHEVVKPLISVEGSTRTVKLDVGVRWYPYDSQPGMDLRLPAILTRLRHQAQG